MFKKEDKKPSSNAKASPTSDSPVGDTKSDDDLIQVINDQQAKINDLINTVQHTRADFENYRKHTEADIERASHRAENKTVLKLLPIIDVLDSAMAHIPDDLKDNAWAHGIESSHKNLVKMTKELKLEKMTVKEGDEFNHEIHNAIQFEDGDGDKEVVAEVLQPGYLYNGVVIRPALVKVTKA